MKWQTGNGIRIWLFRVLAAAAVILMLVSFSMPWWTTNANALGGQFSINIYGFGLRHNMVELRDYIKADETPAYQTALAWVAIGVMAGLGLLGAMLKGIKGRLLIGGAGAAYMAYAAVAVFVVVARRVASFDIALQGATTTGAFKQMGLDFVSQIDAGYYLALVSGGLCIVLAVLRNVIAGKAKS
jgi:hypothetical protein